MCDKSKWETGSRQELAEEHGWDDIAKQDNYEDKQSQRYWHPNDPDAPSQDD